MGSKSWLPQDSPTQTDEGMHCITLGLRVCSGTGDTQPCCWQEHLLPRRMRLCKTQARKAAQAAPPAAGQSSVCNLVHELLLRCHHRSPPGPASLFSAKACCRPWVRGEPAGPAATQAPLEALLPSLCAPRLPFLYAPHLLIPTLYSRMLIPYLAANHWHRVLTCMLPLCVVCPGRRPGLKITMRSTSGEQATGALQVEISTTQMQMLVLPSQAMPS